MICNLCPRNCNVNRENNKGYCKVSENIKVSRAALHFWEEPCISGEKGSGTVFFSGCNMRCIFCQNYDISRQAFGKEISLERLVEIYFELESQKAHNINLVTPGHYAHKIAKSIDISRQKGLKIPFVYNTNSYEKVNSIKMLENKIDIFLPDFKYMDGVLAKNFSDCADYPETAKKSIEQMVKQTGGCVFDENGIMQKGVIVRVLVLPECTSDAKKIIEYLYKTYKDDIFISIMSQYTPVNQIDKYPFLNRKITQEEYDDVVDFAVDLGVENGFIQTSDSAQESFIPHFNLFGV